MTTIPHLAPFGGTRPAAAASRRLSGDHGSIIPEFALVAPFMVLLILGIFEFGMVFRESLNLGAAVRAGARQVTNAGDTRPADFLALQGFQTTMSRAKNVTVNRVSIYKTTAANGAPTDATCLTIVPGAGGAGVSGACNIYSATQLNSLGASYLTNFGPNGSCGGAAWDRYWCPLSRNADQGDPPDYVGFYANVTYRSYTKLLPTTITVTDRAVMRIEPKVP